MWFLYLTKVIDSLNINSKFLQINALPLHEGEEGLVPKHGQLALLFPELDEVEDQRVDHSVGQGILLVQEYPARNLVLLTILRT